MVSVDRVGRRRRSARLASFVGLAAITLLTAASPAAANHSWGNYHFARTQNPFTVKLGDNVSSSWDSYLTATSSDWSRDRAPTWLDASPEPFIASNPLNTAVGPGGTTARKCRPSSSRVEVCDAAYGRNGWLGVASIWASGDHITQATVKLNDTYFASGTYNTPAWRRSVMCQEVGHTFGLDHQDESGADLDTCMDYSTTPNLHPDQHDYNQLASIYQHLDPSNGGSITTPAPAAGRGLERVREGLYVERFGGGDRRYVWVYWKGHGRHYAPPADVG